MARARRRRRPQLILAVLFFFALCVAEVALTAVQLGARVSEPWLQLALGRIFPVLAAILMLGPCFHLPALLAGKKVPTWLLGAFVIPAYLFVLACGAHAVFGAVISLGRLMLGLGPTSIALSALGLALPFALALYGGTQGQLGTRVERSEMVLRGLGSGLVGLRVVQLSDLHAGGLVGARRLRRIAARVERLRPDLVVVTGDLVNAHPHEAELLAPILAGIRAPLGVWACMGNHDHFIDGDAVAEILTRAGVRMLRNEGEVIRRGDGAFWLAGVDDTWTDRADLAAALAQKPAGMPTLLLAHDPNLWPQAIARQVEATLSGHTHGGQVGLVRLHPSLSLARLITPFVAGHYEREGVTLHVSRGTGHSFPLRLGAPTEVGLFELADGPILEVG